MVRKAWARPPFCASVKPSSVASPTSSVRNRERGAYVDRDPPRALFHLVVVRHLRHHRPRRDDPREGKPLRREQIRHGENVIERIVGVGVPVATHVDAVASWIRVRNILGELVVTAQLHERADNRLPSSALDPLDQREV